jgi:sulfoxide reductase heme-binding subunit YedZ
MGGRFVTGRTAQLRVTHEALSLATIAAIVVHAGVLLGDSYLSPSLADITIPFVSGYQRVWTTTGIVAGWMLIVLGLSYYARARIGVARWRTLHRFTALAWLLGVLHSVFEGTDAGTAWFLIAAAAAVLPAGGLLATRLSGPPPRAAVP